MKKAYLKYKFVIHLKYRTALIDREKKVFDKMIRYLELEFDVKPKWIDENKKGIYILTDEEFDEEKVVDYILNFTVADNLILYKNE